MDKASDVIRRSGVRLRSLSSGTGGHADLQLLVSELKQLGSCHRQLAASEGRVTRDLQRWAVRGEENAAVQHAVQLLYELAQLHSASQLRFTEQLRAARYHVAMLLDGERRLDSCRAQLDGCERRERRQLQRLRRRSAEHKQAQLEVKLATLQRAKQTAQRELSERTRENEVAKLVRLKQCLLTLSDANISLAQRTQSVFEVHRDIVSQLPDLMDAEQLQHATYSDASGRDGLARLRHLLAPVLDPTAAAGVDHSLDLPPPYQAVSPQALSGRRPGPVGGTPSQSGLYPSVDGLQMPDGPPAYPGGSTDSSPAGRQAPCCTCGGTGYGWRSPVSTEGSSGFYSPSAPTAGVTGSQWSSPTAAHTIRQLHGAFANMRVQH